MDRNPENQARSHRFQARSTLPPTGGHKDRVVAGPGLVNPLRCVGRVCPLVIFISLNRVPFNESSRAGHFWLADSPRWQPPPRGGGHIPRLVPPFMGW